ncbi:lantibiotic dehydratase [Nonomuraea sp. CA-218870]|uniref:lantibiotic dehydratase n=1 Tax=Nonomuraea sp. CA-218870 TaxID=3239998 RepID=UPI003D92ECC1
MSDQPRFAAAGAALLRVPVAPVARAAGVRAGAGDGEDTAFLREALRDPLLREALEVSSPSLAGVLDRVEAGRPVEEAKRRRAVLATARYLLRMAGRPTPFGLLAGVALAGFGDTAKVRLGCAHAKGVRPDAGWLAGLLAAWERDPAVRRGLRVVANDLCVVRGDRLVLPYVRHGGPDGGGGAKELSVRHSEPVRLALEWAARPIAYEELLGRLRAAFPGASPAAVEAMAGQLVEREVLLTDLRPPLSSSDPLAYVLDRVAAVDDLNEAARLGEVAAALARYADCAPGEGRPAWRAAVASMRALRPADKSPIQVDLRFDADVTLPQAVADEAAAAASALLRMSGPAQPPPHLAEYHTAFLERYGTGQLIPFAELTDAERGLGFPAGYLVPESERLARPAPERHDPHDALLAELAQQALLDGTGEVVLDDELVARLSADEEPHLPPPESAELCVQLLAESAEALGRGEFRLALAPATGSSMAGSLFGRFAYLFPEGSYPMAPVAEAAGGAGPIRAQLVFQPLVPRVANVAQVPVVCEHTLALGAFAERSDPRVLGAGDLLVGADDHRLYLVSGPHDREVTPVSPHMLDTTRLSANAVRLVREIAEGGHRHLRSWSWGAAEALPWLPRVRYGRTVLAPARWRPTARLGERELGEDEWSAELDAWRARWRVPDRVQVVHGDHRVELDLTAPLHRRVLRHELSRRPHASVCEPPGAPEDTGWLDGHANELVVPLTLVTGAARRPRPLPPGRAPRPRHLPGGAWLYAKLYGTRDRQDELLERHLPALIAQLPTSVDRWFFIRYQDPDPHLRLRFHGDPAQVNALLLPALHDWAGLLCDAGLAARLTLDAYEPEVARYGGTGTVEVAERVFAADSAAVLAQLRLRERGLNLGPELLAAANYVDILRGLGDPDWQPWLLSVLPKGEHHAAFRDQRREAVTLIDPDGDWPALAARPGGAELLETWKARRPALAAYGQAVREALAARRLTGTRFTVTGALLHMHHNRLLGIRPTTEQRTLAILRGVVEAGLSRKRFTS